MVRKTVDCKVTENRPTNAENLPSCEKKIPVIASRKTALRDLQNDNIMMGSPSISKDSGPVTDASKFAGNKRSPPECQVNSPCQQSKKSNVANGHLVYVRRKADTELGKSSTCDSPRNNSECLHLRKPNHCEDTTQSISQMQEPKVSYFPAFSPLPVASSISSYAKSSVTCSLGTPGTRLAPDESIYHPVASVIPLAGNPIGTQDMHWEERFKQLQMFLRELDQSDHKDYLQMLRSLSSVELSRLAVELEKRSIRLSLEEAKEFQRVGVLNVLGKSKRNFTPPSTQQSQSEK